MMWGTNTFLDTWNGEGGSGKRRRHKVTMTNNEMLNVANFVKC